MELARLYPGWTTGVVRAPQVGYHTGAPTEVLTLLRGGLLHRGYLTDLFGTDHPGRTPRVTLAWVVWGPTRGVRWSVFAATRETPTVGHLWPSATWFEREAWEMLGTRFAGHTDLRRLLTDYGFGGYPLQRDYPVGGFTEVRFSERAKRVVSRGVAWTQEFRTFEFTSPWQS